MHTLKTSFDNKYFYSDSKEKLLNILHKKKDSRISN